LSVTASTGAVRIAQERGGKGQVPMVLLLLLDEGGTLGLERGFSLLARGSGPPISNTEEEARTRVDLDFFLISIFDPPSPS
jgi:hypothetical protein